MSQKGSKAIRRAAAILQRIEHVSDGNPAELDQSRSITHCILKWLTESPLATFDTNSPRDHIGMFGYELFSDCHR